jgi:hypothetical protein
MRRLQGRTHPIHEEVPGREAPTERQMSECAEHFCPRCNRKHDCEDIPCRVTGLCPDCEIECHDFDDEGD